MGDYGGDKDVLNLISSFLGESSKESARDDGHNRTVADNVGNGQRQPSCIVPFTQGFSKVIIFTKDRPWQIRELFLSMKLKSNPYHIENHFLDIYIIANIEEPFIEAYSHVEKFTMSLEKDYHSCRIKINWLCEDRENNFAQLLEHAVNIPHSAAPTPSPESTSPILMFLTDDCLFLEPLIYVLSVAKDVLQNEVTGYNDKIFGFYTRMHPGITFSQTKNKSSPPPQSHFCFLPSSEAGEGVYAYEHHYGSMEWAYPFDLSGGVYLNKDIITVVKSIRSANQDTNSGLSHPTKVEINGNKVISNAISGRYFDKTSEIVLLVDRKGLLSIPSKPFLLILAINRVQNICKAPLAFDLDISSPSFQSNEIKFSPERLLDFLKNGESFDVERYSSSLYNSSHIGNIFLHSRGSPEKLRNEIKSCFAVSVLLPVHNGPPSLAVTALKSIICQPIDERNEPNSDNPTLSPMQIVIVDDRCEDGSIDAMIKSCLEMEAYVDSLAIEVRDYRANHSHKINDLAKGGIFISIDIHSAPHKGGIGAALNYGLSKCDSEYVARMDSDDIACRGRLLAQLRVLQNPTLSRVSVVGTSSVLFTENEGTNGTLGDLKNQSIHDEQSFSCFSESLRILRCSVPPTAAGFVSWSMIFSCTMIHPSVMYRKSRILQNGGYSETLKAAEDYDLWLRLSRNVGSLLSLPRIGVWHRKHQSRSHWDAKKVQQRQESLALSTLTISNLLEEDVPSHIVSILKNPECAKNALTIDNASMLLCKLEKTFLHIHEECLGQNEVDCIRNDCNERIGELATICIKKFFVSETENIADSETWKMWCIRCPERQLERLALVCHK